MRLLRTLRDLEDLERSCTEDGHSSTIDAVRVDVRGQFVRKRKLSKGLIFGDIKLDDGELLEVMIRSHEGGLTIDEIKHIDWKVHLGDKVTSQGFVSKKEPHGFLFALRSITVTESWSEAHPGINFDHKLDPERNGDASSHMESAAAVKGSLALAPSSQAKATQKYTNIVTINGFNACKYYFSGPGGINCLRSTQCHFWHGEPEDFDKNKRLWLEKRLAQRRAASHIDGDDTDPHSKLLKAQRGRMFCDWLVEMVGEARLAGGTGVIDVAGGKGDIPIQLWNRRGIPTTLIDPRSMKLSKVNRKIVAKANSEQGQGSGMCPQLMSYLDDTTIAAHPELFANCSMLLGMHPDEATEVIVDTALARRKPFAIVPCCVMSRQFPDRKCADGTPVATYEALVTYLKEKDSRIQTAFLPFSGRNQVLYLFDY
uniref:C3H1-type domain-containing protein n=1 Tax=Globisporangium ultimum (strain ATCC 200006 / CBS 805.95 / DAOM BR144) TaxID=431595 RepID=K3X245_GLOUD